MYRERLKYFADKKENYRRIRNGGIVMRISSQSMDTSVKPTIVKASPQVTTETSKPSGNIPGKVNESATTKINIEKSTNEGLNNGKQQEVTYEKLTEVVNTMNEFLKIEKRSAQFVLHEGLDKYYVRLVDAETEEVVKEIPPERLLDAFYEMQKLAGMIVDEKI